MKRVIVAGGGAAGMAAGIAAAMEGSAVCLLEKNEKLGKKLYITGKGRCNVTNDCDGEELRKNVVTNARFLYSSFSSFGSADMAALLKEAGCPLKTERGGRMFPVSDKSSDVIKALEKRLVHLGAEICLGSEVKGLLLEEGRCQGVVMKRKGGREEKAYGDSVVIALGGLSYPSTGSTGDGYRLAKEAGHTVTEMSPALVPFVVKERVAAQLQGVSLRNIEAVVKRDNKAIYRGFGEMMFTHYGVSGPVLLSASSFATKELKKGPLTLILDLKPALSREQLDARLLREFEGMRNKQFKNALASLFPSKLTPVMVERSGISPEKMVNEITRAERERIITATKEFTMTLTGLRDYNEAIITQGGVSVKEVNPSTMESKLVPGLYFAGEMLDLDAVTGGFNLQIAWSTGWAAGKAAGNEGCG